ncbi:MAG: molybdate ABC transporter substrate-binding protein [Vicinamibacterales bacterium]
MTLRGSLRWLVLCGLWLGLAQPLHAEVLVSAASSLSEVLTVIAARFEAASGERVQLNFGASNTLARQIMAGARVDVFISADQTQMDRISADIAPGTRIDLLTNQLAIAVRRGTSDVKTPRDLLLPSVRRLAIGDPAAVPAGVYARQYLEKLGLWADLQPKIVPAGSVRLALAAVESGAAEAAIVYATDVAAAAQTSTAFVVPAADGPRIVYPGTVVKSTRNAAGARSFLAFLQTAEARSLFTTAGFGVIAPATR